MPIISIIVPIYNVEKYLKKCIDSILNHSFSDFELILVDDGSPDNCGEICDEYAKKDNRIKVIHKKNGGLSDARNAGIEIAEGKYLAFIDSDDYIEDDMFEVLYKNIVEYNADMSVCGYYTCYKNTNIRNTEDNELKVMNVEDAIGHVHKISPGAWNKLYKKEVFNNIRYPIGRLNEDVFILMDLLNNCSTIVFDPQPKYYYIQRQNSITKMKFDDRKWDCVRAWELNLEYTIKNYPSKREIIEYKYIGSNIYILDTLIMMNNYKSLEDYKRIKKFIRKNILMIIKNPYVIPKRKLALIAYMVSQETYKKMVYKLQQNRGLID